MIYFFSEAARAEHLEHVAYYEERRPGLGARYLAAFEEAMAKVCETRSAFRSKLRHPYGASEFLGFPSASCIAWSADVEVGWLSPTIAAVPDTGSDGSESVLLKLARRLDRTGSGGHREGAAGPLETVVHRQPVAADQHARLPRLAADALLPETARR